jgi:hypothetical protein
MTSSWVSGIVGWSIIGSTSGHPLEVVGRRSSSLDEVLGHHIILGLI